MAIDATDIKNIANRRAKVERVKTARRRPVSSTNWLRRQLNDPFAREARANGYRSRAAFKILEIDEKFKIFKKGQKVVDLGSSPGGWSQVIVEKVGIGNVLAVDLLKMEEIPGVKFFQRDFLGEGMTELVFECFGGGKCDAVASDMAANTTGDKKTDHLRTLNLLENALEFSLKILKNGGSFVGKIFQGGLERELFEKIRKNFTAAKHFKPLSSRKESVETYLVALGFRG
ncbi:MAG: RlmE family RNA methyltransferase [Rickettsiales bacterium]|jgi:23S rRNA (uridine2552-2'-O)-methyltransferase|nr:RlmE family RNA methyltransferase [Rickettsiales bacterium]